MYYWKPKYEKNEKSNNLLSKSIKLGFYVVSKNLYLGKTVTLKCDSNKRILPKTDFVGANLWKHIIILRNDNCK